MKKEILAGKKRAQRLLKKQEKERETKPKVNKVELEPKKRARQEERLRKKEELEARKRARQEERLSKKEERETKARARQEEIRIQKEKQQKITTLYKKALSYYSKDELTRAEAIFEQILVIEPSQKKAKLYIDKKIPARQKYLERIERKKSKREAK